MTFIMFSIYDSKACFFATPFFEQTEASGIRTFTRWVNQQSDNNMLNSNPEDYSLFTVGEFDNLSGEFKSCLPKNLITASAVKSVTVNNYEVPIKNKNGEKQQELFV